MHLGGVRAPRREHRLHRTPRDPRRENPPTTYPQQTSTRRTKDLMYDHQTRARLLADRYRDQGLDVPWWISHAEQTGHQTHHTLRGQECVTCRATPGNDKTGTSF